MSEVFRAEGTAAAAFAGFFSGEIDFDTHIQQRFALSNHPRQQAAQTWYQAASFAESEYSDSFIFLVVHRWFVHLSDGLMLHQRAATVKTPLALGAQASC